MLGGSLVLVLMWLASVLVAETEKSTGEVHGGVQLWTEIVHARG